MACACPDPGGRSAVFLTRSDSGTQSHDVLCSCRDRVCSHESGDCRAGTNAGNEIIASQWKFSQATSASKFDLAFLAIGWFPHLGDEIVSPTTHHSSGNLQSRKRFTPWDRRQALPDGEVGALQVGGRGGGLRDQLGMRLPRSSRNDPQRETSESKNSKRT